MGRTSPLTVGSSASMASSVPPFLLDQLRQYPRLPGNASETPITKWTDQEAALLELARSMPFGHPTEMPALARWKVLRDAMRIQCSMATAWPWGWESFCQHSLAVGTAAALLAAHHPTVDPFDGLLAGIMHDMGKLVVQQAYGETYNHLLEAGQRTDVLMTRLEREILDTDHCAVGEMLCRHWDLPAAIAFAVHDHHPFLQQRDAGSALSNIVQQANFMAHLATMAPGLSGVLEQPGPSLWHALQRSEQLDLLTRWRMLFKRVSSVLLGVDLTPPAVPTQGKRPRIYLQLQDAKEATLLTDTLLLIGFDPQPMPADRPDPGLWPNGVAGDILCDPPASSAEQSACVQAQVQALSYESFRHPHPPGSVPRLAPQRVCSWLSENLSTQSLVGLDPHAILFQAVHNA